MAVRAASVGHWCCARVFQSAAGEGKAAVAVAAPFAKKTDARDSRSPPSLFTNTQAPGGGAAGILQAGTTEERGANARLVRCWGERKGWGKSDLCLPDRRCAKKQRACFLLWPVRR